MRKAATQYEFENTERNNHREEEHSNYWAQYPKTSWFETRESHREAQNQLEDCTASESESEENKGVACFLYEKRAYGKSKNGVHDYANGCE